MVTNKGIKFALLSAVSLLMILLAVPKPANAYVDPGTGSMVWQMAAAAVIGSLFYVKRILVWFKQHVPTGSPVLGGFLFATCFALIATPVTVLVFEANAVPRFNDLFLIGIVLTAYLFRWEPALYLLGISLAVSAWVLPPNDSFRIQGFQEWYRLLSFAVVAVVLLFLVGRTKARKHQEEETAVPSYRMHGAAAGAD